MTVAQLETKFPNLTKKLKELFEKRIVEIAKYYGDRVSSWDVVNESAQDFAKGAMVPGSGLCKSNYGIMPGDYTFEAFKTANQDWSGVSGASKRFDEKRGEDKCCWFSNAFVQTATMFGYCCW